jgi:hypothetical protein
MIFEMCVETVDGYGKQKWRVGAAWESCEDWLRPGLKRHMHIDTSNGTVM